MRFYNLYLFNMKPEVNNFVLTAANATRGSHPGGFHCDDGQNSTDVSRRIILFADYHCEIIIRIR